MFIIANPASFVHLLSAVKDRFRAPAKETAAQGQQAAPCHHKRTRKASLRRSPEPEAVPRPGARAYEDETDKTALRFLQYTHSGHAYAAGKM